MSRYKYTNNYQNFIIETYQYEIDTIINESKFDLKTKFLELLKLVIKKAHKYRRKVLIYGLASLITIGGVDKVSALWENDNDIQKMSMNAGISDLIKGELSKKADSKFITKKKVKQKQDVNKSQWMNPSELKLSQDGWDYIKHEEGSIKHKGEPILTAYKDSYMITVGWGHAQRAKKSTLKIGDTITKEQAQKYLQEDLTVAADGVRRMFKQWKDNGHDVEITQDQFDVLVSLAFNAGVGALRKSKVARQLKKGNHEKAAEAIKTYRVSKKFPGLKLRREKEYKKFTSHIS